MGIFISFIIGSVWGSFFGLLVDRIPLGKSIVFERSHCDVCQKRLAVWDLVPIFSQLFSRLRCRFCGAKIPLMYLMLELSCGLAFVLAWLGWLDYPQFLLILLSLLLSAFDQRQHAFPLIVWLVFALMMLLTGPSVLLNYIWLILAFLAERFDLKIGSGDFLWLFTASLALTFLQEIMVIQIASLLGIFYYFLFKKRNEIAFIPFLTIAYLMLLLWAQIQ